MKSAMINSKAMMPATTSRIVIIVFILDGTKREITSSKLMSKENLSYSQMIRYLTFLQQKVVVVYEEGTKPYGTTESGFKFLKALQQLDEFLDQKNHKVFTHD